MISKLRSLQNKFVNFIKFNKKLLLILFIAAVLQISFLVLVLNRFGWGREGFIISSGDPKDYLKLALNILKYKAFVYTTEPYVFLDTFRLPLYPLYVAGAYKIFGQFWAVIIFQQLFFALPTLIVIWKIFENIFDRRTAFIGTLLVALDIQRVVLVGQFSAESLFLLCFFLFIFCIIKLFKNFELKAFTSKNFFYLACAGLFLGLAVLTRAFVLTLVVVVLLSLCIAKLRQQINLRQLTISFLIFLGVLLLTISPWIIRNYYNFKVFKISTTFEYNFFTRHLKRIYEYKFKNEGANINNLENLVWDKRLGDFKKDNGLEGISDEEAILHMWSFKYSDYEKRKAFQVIGENFGIYLQVWAHRIPGWFLDNSLGEQLAFFSTYFYSDLAKLAEPYQALWFGRFIFLALYLTIIIGFLAKPVLFLNRFNSLVFLFLVAGIFVVSGAMVYTPRHKLPIDFMTYNAFVFIVSYYWTAFRRKNKIIRQS